ncbi:MAG: tyrosine--tRNA ligase, partial [Candidatus Omnitrophica bacterium]|nr:tyrosine--tRNA ligase [Candidatus Omnitrophota bacterium]
GIEEKPDEIFGKIMSISDKLMIRYYELLTDELIQNLKKGIEEGKLHPKKVKENLAEIIVTQYHGRKAAQDAKRNFEKVFTKKKAPADLPEIKLNIDKVDIISLIKKTNLISSSSEAKRLLAQGAVSVDGKKIKDPNSYIIINKKGKIIKIGKRRFAKVLKANK